MAVTWQDIQDLVYAGVSESSTAAGISPTKLLAIGNKYYKQLACFSRTYYVVKTYTLTVGVREINIGDSWLEIHLVEFDQSGSGNYLKLRWIPEGSLKTFLPSGTSSVPTHWTMGENVVVAGSPTLSRNLIVDPPPYSTGPLRIRGYAIPPALTGGSSVLLIPDHHAYAVADGVLAFYLAKDGRIQEAQVHMGLFKAAQMEAQAEMVRAMAADGGGHTTPLDVPFFLGEGVA